MTPTTATKDAASVDYHKRSNVETTFHMIKARFDGQVRSKTPDARVNETLLKVLCHNICVVIQAVFEFGLEPTFLNPEDA